MSLTNVLLQFPYTVAILCVLLYAVFRLLYNPNSGLKLPPGPRGIPFFGCLPFLGDDIHLKLHEMAKKYGPVFGLYIGTQYFIVVEDFDDIKKVCSNEEFLDRPKDYFRIAPEYENLIEVTGSKWKDQRKFQLTTFKKLGFTKTKTHLYTLNEIRKLISLLTETSDKPRVDLQEVLDPVFNNIIYYLLYGKQFEPDHPYMLHLGAFTEAISMTYRWEEDSVFKPWLNTFLDVFCRKLKKQYKTEINFVGDILCKEVEEHRRNLEPENPKDFIDYFLLEMRSREDPTFSGFTDTSLVGNVLMLFGAGSVTTRLTLTWFLMELAQNPQVQEKCLAEILEKLGPDRDPERADQNQLPYLCATIAESQRRNPISFLNLLRQCNTSGATIGSYDVPKDTVILQNLWSVNYRKDLWENPEVFMPERFLYEDGQKVVIPEYLTPFSYGKRQCPGMKLANTSLFLFAVCLIRSFRFLPPDGGLKMDYILFFNVTPLKPFVRIQVRSNQK